MTPLLNRNPKRDLGVLLRAPRRTPSKGSIKAAFALAGLEEAFSSTIEHQPGIFDVRTKLKTLDGMQLMLITDTLNAASVAIGIYRGHVVLSMSID